MRTIIKVADGHAETQQFVKQIITSRYNRNDVLHSARNTIWKFCDGDLKIAVKKFRNSFKTMFLYSIRKSKARRSYENALLLMKRGDLTPEPIGYVESRGIMHTLLASWYLCEFKDSISLDEAIDEYGLPCIKQFALFVARLHENGIRHDDLNSTNVRVFIDSAGDISFALIDLNRMKIYESGKTVPLNECFGNICRFSNHDEKFLCFVNAYIDARQLPDRFYNIMISVKKKHDRRVDMKKYIKKLFSK